MPRPWVPAVAALLALNLPAHLLYLGWVPGRPGWWLLWAGLTALLVPAVRWLVPPTVARLRGAGPVAIWLPPVVGVLLAGWWHGVVLDVLWLHGSRGRAVLLPVLFFAHAVFGATITGGLLAALIATDPPAERPSLPGGRQSVTPFVLFAVTAAAFAGWCVSRERTVYACDGMYYWDRAAGWAERLRADPAAGADEFRRSVQADGYTLLPVLPHGLAMAALGDHRLVYVLTTAAVYLTAVVVAVAGFARRLSPGRATVAPAALVGLLPVAWGPVLGGYPDAGGVALAVASLAVYLSAPAGRLRWPALLTVSAVLVGLVLFRRWYAFWVVAFGLLAAADAVAAAVRGGRVDAVRCLRQPITLGVMLVAGLAAVALPGVRQMAGGDFAGAFAAYKHEGSVADRLGELVRIVGPVYPVAAGVSLVVLVATPAGRRPALFVAGMVPMMVAHFMRVQDFNPHHLYLLLPALAALPAAALARLPRMALVPAAGVGLALFLPAVTDPGWPPAGPVVFRPQRRGDLDEFGRLADFLNACPADEATLVLSSSPALHASMADVLGRSLRVPFPAASRLLPMADVDRVSGFPASVFRAGLVLVADPPQTHLRPAEQQVVLLPAGDLIAGTGIAVGFDRLPETFAFDGAVTLRAFRRARPIPPAVVAGFVERLRQAHPDTPRVFTPPEPP